MKRGLLSILNIASFVVCVFTLTVTFIDVSALFYESFQSGPPVFWYRIAAQYFLGDAFLRLILSKDKQQLFFSRLFDLPLGILFLPSVQDFLLDFSIWPVLLVVAVFGRIGHLANGLKFLNLNPAQLFLLGFVYITFLGMLLLSMPISLQKEMSLTDLVFTATSAVCVTGLMTINVADTFTPFGQFILLLLIQLGGLGVMTFYGLFSLFSHRKLSQKEQVVYKESLLTNSSQEFVGLIRTIIYITVVVEFIGFLFLFLAFFLKGIPVQEGVFKALFLAVSGFSNAGITNFSNGLADYGSNVLVLMTLSFLILIGGIGFPVLFDCARIFKKKLSWQSLKAQTKLCLVMSAVLIIIGTLGIYWVESAHSYAQFPIWKQLLLSFFHSISSRTAGFATHSLVVFQNQTLWILVVLMFIGTAPGSTGGGIKTSTFGLLLTTLWQVIRGENEVFLFGRTIPKDNILRLISVTSISLIVIGAVLFLMLSVENLPFLNILFETVSAFATAGFTLDSTEKLSEAGKWIIIVTMFFGRLGPLSIAFALTRKKQKPNYKWPEESILIG